MTPTATTTSELLQPLQSFLEAFTQELTEQKFVPAFRDELKRLMGALEALQASEDSLQQIARGVDRLREVFAPAGTRLLEGAKDLEEQMRSNSEVLRERADAVLRDLVQTHESLEAALRAEAGLLQDQTSASREVLTRTVGDMEGRLSGLTSQVDMLCRHLEQKAEEFGSFTFAQPAENAAVTTPPNISAALALPEELRELIAGSQQSVVRELERHRQELAEGLRQNRGGDDERLAQLETRVNHALAAVGPRLQEEIESAVSLLRDQIQTLILAEIESRRLSAEQLPEGREPAAFGASIGEFTAALTGSESRILREMTSLRKSQKAEQSEAEQILKELVQGLNAAASRYDAQSSTAAQTIQESVSALREMVAKSETVDQKNAQQMQELHARLDGLAADSGLTRKGVEDALKSAQQRVSAQAQLIEVKVQEDRHAFAQMMAAFSRAEQAANSATELTLSDGRVQRDKIENGLKDLRERVERGFAVEAEQLQAVLHQIAEAWTEALETLREFVQKTVAGRTDEIIGWLRNLEVRLEETRQADDSVQRELQAEVRRTGTVFDERIHALKDETQAFTTTMESHVKAVSGEVAALRSKQEQQLAVLKEAIRANYDDNAQRLREVVEAAYDSFIQQTSGLPQSLERFAHLIQSLHQGDQLALQAVASDTKNLLSMSRDSFETLVNDNAAVKKIYPLIDKKLEKQNAELELVRKAQVRHDKDLDDLKGSLALLKNQQETKGDHVRSDLSRLEDGLAERFGAVKEDLAALRRELEALQREDLPNSRRELSAMLTSKFELIERTLQERQDGLRKEMLDAAARGRRAGLRAALVIAALVALSIALQLFAGLGGSGGIGP